MQGYFKIEKKLNFWKRIKTIHSYNISLTLNHSNSSEHTFIPHYFYFSANISMISLYVIEHRSLKFCFFQNVVIKIYISTCRSPFQIQCLEAHPSCLEELSRTRLEWPPTNITTCIKSQLLSKLLNQNIIIGHQKTK